MEELLEKAKKFMYTNTDCNEVELTDFQGNKVRLVRITPTPCINYPYPFWPYTYTPTTTLKY